MDAPRYIDEPQFRARAEAVLQRSIDPVAGLYGPDSLMWRLGRESLIFLGGGRAALLQLAHPWVANAIDQHSRTRDDPVGRFRRTFTQVFAMVYGSTDQAWRAAQRVHRIHRRIGGEIAEDSGAWAQGSAYRANEVDAMLWVHATLWDTQLRVYELVFPPLTHAERERYYRETKLFASLFGIPDDALPPDWAAFQDYLEGMYASDRLVVRRAGRDIGQLLFDFPGPLRPALHGLRTLTADLMPPRLREEFGLPPDTPATRRNRERGLAALRLAYPRLPARLRHVPPYQEALRRIAGKPHADLFTQGLSLAWVGRRELVSAGC